MPQFLTAIFPEYLIRDMHAILSAGSPPLFLQLLALNAFFLAVVLLKRTSFQQWSSKENAARMNALFILANGGVIANSSTGFLF